MTTTEGIPCLAFGSGPNDYELLPEDARTRWKEIGQQLANRWQRGSSDRQLADQLSGCLDKLSASLMQIARLRSHEHTFLQQGCALPQMPGVAIALRGADACADFEGLLLHGRATLDRLTWFVSGQFGQQCNSFRRLKSTLRPFYRRPLFPELTRLISVLEPWASQVFAPIDSPDSLRDLVGHREALTERMRVCFAAHRTSRDAILLLDCEVQLSSDTSPVAVFQAAAQAAAFLSCAVLDVASLYLDMQPMGIASYSCRWTPVAVQLSKFITSYEDGGPIQPNMITFARRMHATGFDTETRPVSSEVLQHIVRTPP